MNKDIAMMSLDEIKLYIRNLEDAVSYMKKTLNNISEFGFKNSGRGYSCAMMAKECLVNLE